ncbi:2-C-methyl-D-erythritol 4-phosphate cytidylyltransferase, partial [gut metagenome]
MSPQTKIVSLICAAGVGSRMRLGHPKQYMMLGDAPMLLQTIRALKRVERIDEIVVVVSPTDPYIDTLAEQFPEGVRVLRCGGRERAESVVNGLIAAAFPREAWVLVHDAARPCVRPAEVGLLLDTVLSDDSVAGGILASPVADTLKRADAQGRIL